MLPARIATDVTVSGIRDGIFRALDRPAREALELARRPTVHTATPAAVGVVLIAVASIVAALPSLAAHNTRDLGLALSVDGLRPLLETLAAIMPLTLVLSGYLRLATSSRAILAAFAIGLLLAGVVSVSLLSMVFFLVVVSGDNVAVPTLLSMVIPCVALGTILSVVVRVSGTIDPSRRAWLVTRFAATLAAAVFLDRTASHYAALLLHL
jgi:hypothetical protein